MLLDLSKPYNLILGDCLEVMPGIPVGSVDAIIADWPYGTTACKWDSVIPLEPLWGECKRVIKGNGAIVLTASQPFTSILVMSNLKWFKYDWVWNKNTVTGVGNAEFQPMRTHESVCVFYQLQPIFNKQKTPRFSKEAVDRYKSPVGSGVSSNHYRSFLPMAPKQYDPEQVNPRTSLKFDSVPNAKKLHPTQKPVALMEYLIKTYTNPGDLVLDNTMGSGSTGEACLRTERRFIGIEKDEGYFEIAKNRLERVERELRGEQLEMAI